MTDQSQPERESVLKLDRGTLVPIGLLVAVVMASISATVWINTYLLKLTQSVERVDLRVSALNQQMETLNHGTWTLSDMRAWVTLANARNANVTFPEPNPLR